MISLLIKSIGRERWELLNSPAAVRHGVLKFYHHLITQRITIISIFQRIALAIRFAENRRKNH